MRAQSQQLMAPADFEWVDTGITVSAGQGLRITASGQWSNGGGQPRFVGPDGFQGFRIAGTLLPSANLASLIGKIGSTIFSIGSNYSRVSPVSGKLFLSMNDLPNTFADNKGSLRVSIELTRVSSIKPVDPQPTTAGGKLTPDQIRERTKEMFEEDGCPKDLGTDPRLDAFETFLMAKQVEREGRNESTDLNALKLFCRAAKAGSGLADLEIGALYERGFTLPNIYTPDMIYSNSWGGDKDMALKWYLRAADRGNSAGMYLAGYFYRFGTRMTGYHHPVEFLKALPLMERAASLGDVEAMLALLTIYGDGGESPNPRLATETRERLRHRIAEVQSKCVRKNSEIRALMPERQIKGLIFGLAHSSSYSCIAVFEGEEEGDSLAEELAYVAQAKMFPGWTFTVFSNDDRSFEKVTAASAGEQIEKYATEVAIIISAVKAIQQP